MIVLIYEKGDTYEMDYSLIYDPFPDKKEEENKSWENAVMENLNE